MSLDTPEIEVADAPAAEPTLRESMETIRDEIVAREEAPAAERDEHGRFKAKAAPEDAPAADAAPVAPEAAPEAVAPPETPPEAVEAAPQSLSAEAKAKWAETPAEVRAEFTRRENDVRQLVGRMDGERQQGRAIQEVLTPYLPIMRQGNVEPMAFVGNLLQTAWIMNTADAQKKAQTLAQIADQYGVDMDAAYQFRGQHQALPQAAAVPATPIDVAAQVEAIVQQRETQREIETFFADPKYPHANAVRNTMAALMESGDADSLHSAYDMAVYARPDLRSTLLAEQAKAKEAQQAVSHRVAQAKQAAVSLPGSSGSPRPAGAETSLRDELRNGLREMTSAA